LGLSSAVFPDKVCGFRPKRCAACPVLLCALLRFPVRLPPFFAPGVRARCSNSTRSLMTRRSLKPKNPAGGSLPALCQPSKDIVCAVGGNSLVETHIQRGRIDEGNTGAVPHATQFEISAQGDQCGRDVVHETLIADQAREFALQVRHDIFQHTCFIDVLIISKTVILLVCL